MGKLFIDQGDHDLAEELYEEVLVLSREFGDASTLATCLTDLGYVSLLQGNHAKATVLGKEAMSLSRERGFTGSLARALNCLGWAALLRGDHERASGLYKESLALYKESGDKASAAESLEGLACAAGARGESEWPARLFGAAETARDQQSPAQRALREPYLVAARSRLDATAWEAAFAEGRAMKIEEAIAHALEDAKRQA